MDTFIGILKAVFGLVYLYLWIGLFIKKVIMKDER